MTHDTFVTEGDLTATVHRALAACGVPSTPAGTGLTARSPITGAGLAQIAAVGQADVELAIARSHAAFLQWRSVPAPQRGALVKAFGRLLEQHKQDLADLVTLEVGKITSEALGEVQEMIDICDFAVGLSRQLVRPHHDLRAARPPADGDVAPARCRRRDQRLQLPGRGVVLERRDRAGLR